MKRQETPMELYARTDIPVYAHINRHNCGCITAWDVKSERYVYLLHSCISHE